MRIVTAAGAVLLCLVTAACTDSDDGSEMRDAETVAAEARAEIDDLAQRLGTDPEVRHDTLVDCEVGDEDAGKYLSYNVHVRVEPGTLERLRTEIAADYEADGWTVRQDPEGTRFLKGQASIGAKVYEDKGGAAVFGSGGCGK